MNSFVVLWSNDWCELLKKADEKSPLSVVYGGPHQSLPSLGKVKPGDWVYPLRVKSGKLFLIGKMKVVTIRDAEEYLAEIGIPRLKGELWDTISVKYIKTHPAFGHKIPRTCVDDVALGTEGTPICFNLEVPLSLVEQLQFGTVAGKETGLPLKAGKVSHINLQGHYRRLSEASCSLLDRFLLEKLENTIVN